MRVFLSGPMSGYDNWNFEAFNTTETLLKQQGHEVFSGHILFKDEVAKGITRTHKEYVTETIKYLIDSDVECIYVMKDWEQSKGAKAEVAVGLALGIDIYDLDIRFKFTRATIHF